MTRYRVTVVTSKSSFLPKEPNRRILRGYRRGVRSNNIYLCIYWVEGLIRGRKVVRGVVNIIRGVCVSK